MQTGVFKMKEPAQANCHLTKALGVLAHHC
jgi:hypothetical protein